MNFASRALGDSGHPCIYKFRDIDVFFTLRFDETTCYRS